MSIRLRAVALALLATACGSDEATPDAGAPADADPAAPDATPADTAVVLAVSGDFNATGVLSTVGVPSLEIGADVASGVASQDPVLRVLGDVAYVVNRFGVDNVTLVDAAAQTLIMQHSTGAGSNPQDVARVGDKLYVPALGTAGVVVVDLADAGALSMIDLSEFDPLDLKPNCNSIIAVGTSVVVTCGILDDTDTFLTPRGPGHVVVIDTADDTIADDVALPGTNPVGWLKAVPGVGLLAGLVPSYSDFSTGCLAAITLEPTLTATCLLTNQALGGYANGYAVAGDALWLAVDGFDAEFNGFGVLRRYDLATDALDATTYSPAGQVILDVTTCPDGHVVVADRPASGPSGLRLYDAAGAEVTAAPLAIGLPPSYGNGLACHGL